MKLLAFFAVFLLFVNLSLQLPQLDNCPPDFVVPSSIANSCGRYSCGEQGSISGVGCGTYQCADGKELGNTEPDNSKPYPECCGGPICAD